MKTALFIIFSIAFLASCSPTKKNTQTVKQNISTESANSAPKEVGKQDGLSFQTAVFITEKSETTGPSAEYKWIKEHYTDYKVKGQALVYNNNKPFDIITIVFNNGKQLKLYFDISNYFGKF